MIVLFWGFLQRGTDIERQRRPDFAVMNVKKFHSEAIKFGITFVRGTMMDGRSDFGISRLAL
jgi:hypothetical protein